MKKTLATIDEDFAQIDRLLRELRQRIGRAAEAVHVLAAKAAAKTARKPRRSVKR